VVRLAWLVLCALLLPAGWLCQAEEPPRLSDAESKDWRGRIWTALEDGSEKTLNAIRVEIEKKKLTVRQVEELIRAGKPYEEEKKGEDVRQVTLRYDGTQAEYGIYVPQVYDATKPCPLIVELHGSGGTGPSYLPLTGWKEIADKEGFIVAAPTTSKERGQIGTRYGAELVWATIRDVKVHYNVDMDRVYLSGFSRGGHATWWLGILSTDRFAGIAPHAGSPKNLLTVDKGKERIWEFFPNVRRLPIYMVHGIEDPMVPIDGPREARDRLKELEGDFVLDEQDGGHTNFPERSEKIWEFWKGKSRDPVPKKVSWIMNEKLFARGWWVKIDEIRATGGNLTYVIQDPTGHEIEKRSLAINTARAAAEVEDAGTISINARNCSSVTLYLDDRLVDLDKEVSVVVSGIRGKHRFTRSLKTLLETASERLDPGMAFPVKQTFRVP